MFDKNYRGGDEKGGSLKGFITQVSGMFHVSDVGSSFRFSPDRFHPGISFIDKSHGSR